MKNKVLILTVIGIVIAIASAITILVAKLNKFFKEIEPYGEVALDEDCYVGI